MTTNPDNTLHFGAPELLLPALALAALLAGALVWESVRRRRALSRVAAPELQARLTATASRPRRTLKRILLWSAAALSLLALTRPQWGYRWEETSRQGIELMFAVDTSKSMLARDLRPDRLTRAKLAIADLVRKFPSDRVGLVAFAGDAFLQVPMTLDREVFMDSLQVLKPGVIPVGGSDLASAIRVADRAFTEAGSTERILILLSDGEDLQGSAIEAAREAAEHGVVIHTIGVGGAAGELLEIPDGRGGTQVVRDENGQPVRSRLDEATLTAIASATGGTYEALGEDGLGLQRLYESALSELQRHQVESRSRRVYYERYAWLLIPALMLLLLEPFISERGRPRSLSSERARRLPRGAAPTAVALALLLAAPGALAAGDARLAYNSGVTAYEAGDWETAAAQFTAALDEADPDLHPPIWYNLGSALYRQGEATLDTDTAQTRDAWEQALTAFETAVELDPSDEDAVFNRDLVKRKLQELEEPPPEENDGTCDNPSPEDDGQSSADSESDQGDQDGDQGDGQASAQDDGQGDQDGDQGDQAGDQDGDQGDQAGDQDGDQGDQAGDQSGDQGDQDGDGQASAQSGDRGGDQGDQDGDGQASAQGGDRGGDQASAQGQGDDQSALGGPGAEQEAGGDPLAAAGAQAGDTADPTAPTAGLAATAGDGEHLTPEQAAALIRAAGGSGATTPLFVPAQPSDPEQKTHTKDW